MRRAARSAFPYAAFFLTGVGTALLGATLPAVLHAWQLSDGAGGSLLLAGWAGSTAGALFARRGPLPSAIVGLFLAAGALLVLAEVRPPWPGVDYLAYGIGLGLTMTSISLYRSRGLAPREADPELNRLNLIWALGACAAPALAVRSLHVLSVHVVFGGMGLVFAAAGLCGLMVVLAGRATARAEKESSPKPTLSRAPLRFALFAAASVGLESALGSWLTTYARRNHAGVEIAVSANLAFWAGLLVSRAAHSVRSLRQLHTALARGGHILAVVVGMAGLLTHPSPAILPWASLLCGLGLGPLYPFVLSVSLPRFDSTSVFVLAGLGGAMVPWLTGLLSSYAGSLRWGLAVPFLTLVPLVVTHLLVEQRDRPGFMPWSPTVDSLPHQ